MTNTDIPMSGGLPVVTDFSPQAFDGVALSLVDLYRYGAAMGQAVVSGKTFTNCRIEGPGVLLAVGGLTFDATDFGYSNGDVRTLVLHPASPKSVIGAIPMQNCLFRNCVFFGVGFTGPKSFTDQVLAIGDRP